MKRMGCRQFLAFAIVMALNEAACDSRDKAAAPTPTPSAVPPAARSPESLAAEEAAVAEAAGNEAAGAPVAIDEAAGAPVAIDEAAGAPVAIDEAAVDEVAGVDGVDDVTPNESPSTATFHVFLLLGQSNMAGYPKAQAADRTENPRVKVLGFDSCAATGRVTDEWDVAAPPLHECWNDGLGPGDYFAKALLEVIPEGDTIGLVPCAISGERIETFSKLGGARYDYIVRRARMAQEAGGVIEGILFHQGESNSGDPTWPGKVDTLVTDLRADLALGDVPFLAGELLYTGGTAGHNVLVNQLPSVISNAFVISASGLVVDPADTQWNLHFGHDSVVEFGKRYAQTMVAALGW